MPGYLSQMFGGDGGESQSDSQHLGAADAVGFDVPMSVHTEASGSYETADGTTHEWSSTHDVGAEVSSHEAFSAVVDTAESTVTDF